MVTNDCDPCYSCLGVMPSLECRLDTVTRLEGTNSAPVMEYHSEIALQRTGFHLTCLSWSVLGSEGNQLPCCDNLTWTGIREASSQ
jgi:hypothetical protein